MLLIINRGIPFSNTVKISWCRFSLLGHFTTLTLFSTFRGECVFKHEHGGAMCVVWNVIGVESILVMV
ncbi:hypothetical protein HanIR_Chr17g0857501 [Helianthus annuus]|nr:hypothetical protein HanIR_Chr17g0857501 [Helianthus annuus]